MLVRQLNLRVSEFDTGKMQSVILVLVCVLLKLPKRKDSINKNKYKGENNSELIVTK